MSKTEVLQQAGENRNLAEHGRRMSRVFTQPDDQARAQEYIDELEATAVRLETEASAVDQPRSRQIKER